MILIKDFPTNKKHVSYSEVRCWKECAYRHKLQHIDKVDLGRPSPYLDFGSAVHEGCENYLKTGNVKGEIILNEMRNAWTEHGFEDSDWIKKQPGWYRHEPLETWCAWATNIWEDIPQFLDKTFPWVGSCQCRRGII